MQFSLKFVLGLLTWVGVAMGLGVRLGALPSVGFLWIGAIGFLIIRRRQRNALWYLFLVAAYLLGLTLLFGSLYEFAVYKERQYWKLFHP